MRALAAERRLKMMAGGGGRAGGLSCSFCGEGLEGKVPFDRLSFRYCSMVCLSGHRQELET